MILPIVPFYFIIYITHSAISCVSNDDILPSYIMNIIINISYLSTVMLYKFQPTYYVANVVMSMLIAFYIYDIQKVLFGKFSLTDKLTYIPHHIVTILLVLGQLYHLYPLSVGMWYLTLFEFSNFFLQFFHLFQQKRWITARNFVSYPFVLTYVPIRGLLIPLYSFQFNPYVLVMNTQYKIIFSFLFTFVNVFSVYFAWIVLTKFISHYKNNTNINVPIKDKRD